MHWHGLDLRNDADGVPGLVVDDPREPLAYDDEWVIVLDDWLDGLGASPDEVLDQLRQGMMGAGTG